MVFFRLLEIEGSCGDPNKINLSLTTDSLLGIEIVNEIPHPEESRQQRSTISDPQVQQNGPQL